MEELEKKRRLARLAEKLTEHVTKHEALRNAFRQHAQPEEMNAVRDYTGQWVEAYAESLGSEGDTQRAAQEKMYESQILRAETYVTVMNNAYGGLYVDGSLANFFRKAGERDDLRVEGAGDVLERINAPSLARAARVAENKP